MKEPLMTYSQKEYMDHFRLPYFPRNHRTPTTKKQADSIIIAAQQRAGFWGEEAQREQMSRYKVTKQTLKIALYKK